MSRPSDWLPAEATAATISSGASPVAHARTMAVPMRPVAPINTALVIGSLIRRDSVPQRRDSCETAAP